jgi:thiamine-monophosphate kinase
MAPRGEERFVSWLARQSPRSLVGDDTATLPPLSRSSRLVVTVDQQIEGTHFAPGLDPVLLGRRLLRVNLSDLAASGARPRWAFLALGLPVDVDPKPIVRGVLADARRFGVALAGGDVARAEVLSASLTLLGEKGTRDASLGRDRARAGHALWLGGTVGESALGCELSLRGEVDLLFSKRKRKAKSFQLGERLETAAGRAARRNLLPVPQLELGRWLASLGKRAGACIDVSDGLAKDLRRVCVASGVGAELDLRLVKRATPARFEALAEALGLDPIAVALAGGEDYVLLFTLPAGIAPPVRFGCLRVGRMARGRAVTMLDAGGVRHPLPKLGWDHLDSGD